MGLDFVSGQYGCLFSRCWKYAINSLIHGHFHIGLVIIPGPILALDSISGQYGGLWMITRPIWKCPCINLYLIRHATLLLFIYCYKIYHESALKKQNHQPHVFIIFERWNIRGTISQKINHFLQIWETNLLKLYKNKR